MDRIVAIVLSVFAVLTVAGGISVEETIDIEMVTHKIGDLESNLFAIRYGKKYSSVHDVLHRFNTFVENVELIESTNRRKLPYTVGINEFADMTWEEFHRQYLGAPQNCSATKATHKLTDAKLPEKHHWSTRGSPYSGYREDSNSF